MDTLLKLVAIIAVSAFLLQGIDSTNFSFKNNCPYTVWPATLHGGSSPPLPKTGFQLDAGAAVSLDAPSGWSGRMWARNGCAADDAGKFSCQTGDCGSGSVECNDSGGAPPATLIEFTLNGADGKDFYDVSLVDGFNVPVAVNVEGGSGECKPTGCRADVNAQCPEELQVKGGGGSVVGCKSACGAFGTDQYCCKGEYDKPDKCEPSSYSKMFKAACPDAYSYAYDDKSSTFTCTGANYGIVFCP